MIDGVGPFFTGHPRGRINWSKIPFSTLERGGRLDREGFRTIRELFKRFAGTAAAMGFTAVSLDDLAHLTDFPAYSPGLRRRITDYREEFDVLFDLAHAAGLKPYLTTDIVFFNRELDAALGRDDERIVPFLKASVEALFRDFPRVSGLIIRFGESDGVDVKGEFRSRPVLRTPSQVRRYLLALLSVCEPARRNLVVRTWSLGAYPVGDLMWNRRTYEEVFGLIRSPQLFISMKYGETDFFRYVPLCSHFREDPHHAKIVELQARREYEGFGDYPSFVGWDYERYMRELAGCRNMAGVWVWCQTGGWTASRRITFVKDSSVWNEINVHVTAGVVIHGLSVDEAVRRWCREHLPGRDPEKCLELLKLSAEVIRELLYLPDYAGRSVYFRRLRLPPLLHVFWDTILITGPVRTWMRHFTRDRRATIQQGYDALDKIKTMEELAVSLGLPAEDLRAQYAAFEILAVAREVFLGPRSRWREGEHRLRGLIQAYRRNHGGPYSFVVKMGPSRMSAGLMGLGLRLVIRHTAPYRLSDRLVYLRALAGIGWLLKFWPSHRLPRLVGSQGMELRHFLK